MVDENLDNIKKCVDESWKDAVQKEREASEKKGEPFDKAQGSSRAGSRDEEEPLEVNFNLFITGLMMEALLALGEMENPITHKKEANLQHAKFLIDTIEMLQDKTKNNLTKEEEGALSSILYDLRMRFVSKVNKQGSNK